MSRRLLKQSLNQFIPKIFSGVEVRVLSRPLKIFLSNSKPFLCASHFVSRGQFNARICFGLLELVILPRHHAQLYDFEFVHSLKEDMYVCGDQFSTDFWSYRVDAKIFLSVSLCGNNSGTGKIFYIIYTYS